MRIGFDVYEPKISEEKKIYRMDELHRVDGKEKPKKDRESAGTFFLRPGQTLLTI